MSTYTILVGCALSPHDPGASLGTVRARRAQMWEKLLQAGFVRLPGLQPPMFCPLALHSRYP